MDRLSEPSPIHRTYLRLPLEGQEKDIPVASAAKTGSGMAAGLAAILNDVEVSPSE